MSSSGPSIQSRPSLTKSQIGSRPAIDEPAELPTVEERVEELYELYPDKARTPLLERSADDPREAYDPDLGVTVREEVARGTNGGDTFTITWGGGVRWFLEWVEDRREPVVGRFLDPDGEIFEKEFKPHSFDPDYLKTDYAKLKGLGREIERLERPGVALLTLTSSGVGPGGEPRGPIDHQLERRAAWDKTRKALKYEMEKHREAGRISDWGYVVVEEQHPGKGLGKNAGYGHTHPYVWFDGELEADEFRPVISTWIDACPNATRDAHDPDHPDPDKRPIDVRRVDPEGEQDRETVTNVASYITKYLYPDEGENDPLERPIERVMYEAVKWATNTRRLRKSDNSNRAIAADLCRQKAERVDARAAHGERLTHDSGRGPEIVCAECGSGWDIDPEAGTIVEARRPDGPTNELEAIVIDGEEFEPSGGGVETRTVLGWNHVPKRINGARIHLPEIWASEDRRGAPVTRPGEGSPSADRFGRRWEDRPPPAVLKR